MALITVKSNNSYLKELHSAGFVIVNSHQCEITYCSFLRNRNSRNRINQDNFMLGKHQKSFIINSNYRFMEISNISNQLTSSKPRKHGSVITRKGHVMESTLGQNKN